MFSSTANSKNDLASDSDNHSVTAFIYIAIILMLFLCGVPLRVSAQNIPRESDVYINDFKPFRQQVPVVSALAMHGQPANDPKFTSFAYVNPYAPKNGTLRLGVVGTFDSLNPFIVRGQTPLGINTGTMSLVYETLMTRSWDEPFTLYGLIAQGVEVPQDRSSITFILNPAARWQNGRSITADDVVFSFETLRDKGRPNHRTYYSKVSRIVPESNRRIRFDFAAQTDGSYDREMPLIIALMPILPKSAWKDRKFDETTWEKPLGSGPYRVDSVDPGRSITYTRNPNWWAKDLPVTRGLYNFDAIKVSYWRDERVALEAFRAKSFDIRRESDLVRFVTAYEGEAKTKGLLRLGHFIHSRPEAVVGFVFNTRRPQFESKPLREACALVLDTGWLAKNLFYGQASRINSFFPNSELSAYIAEPPQGMEKQILTKLGDKIPAEIITTPLSFPNTDGTAKSRRDNMMRATKILREAGYKWEDGILVSPQGKHVTFEILLGDPSDEKIALSWKRALQVLGVYADVRTVDSAQYQERLNSFDYDVVVARWVNSLSPGNEQQIYWGSAAADKPGSRNYAGIKDPAVDALVNAITASPTREVLLATTRALDRVLLAGNYVVPFFYKGYDPIAYWTNRVIAPDTPPLYGTLIESWWAAPGAREEQ